MQVSPLRGRSPWKVMLKKMKIQKEKAKVEETVILRKPCSCYASFRKLVGKLRWLVVAWCACVHKKNLDTGVRDQYSCLCELYLPQYFSNDSERKASSRKSQARLKNTKVVDHFLLNFRMNAWIDREMMGIFWLFEFLTVFHHGVCCRVRLRICLV